MISALLLALPLLCSEHLVWDASPGAEWYEIQRTYQGPLVGSQVLVVGSTRGRSETTYHADGTVAEVRDVAKVPEWRMCWDAPSDWASRTYTLRVAACSTRWTPNCGAWSTPPVRFKKGK